MPMYWPCKNLFIQCLHRLLLIQLDHPFKVIILLCLLKVKIIGLKYIPQIVPNFSIITKVIFNKYNHIKSTVHGMKNGLEAVV